RDQRGPALGKPSSTPSPQSYPDPGRQQEPDTKVLDHHHDPAHTQRDKHLVHGTDRDQGNWQYHQHEPEDKEQRPGPSRQTSSCRSPPKAGVTQEERPKENTDRPGLGEPSPEPTRATDMSKDLHRVGQEIAQREGRGDLARHRQE